VINCAPSADDAQLDLLHSLEAVSHSPRPNRFRLRASCWPCRPPCWPCP
jgi:hypothetical protein